MTAAVLDVLDDRDIDLVHKVIGYATPRFEVRASAEEWLWRKLAEGFLTLRQGRAHGAHVRT